MRAELESMFVRVRMWMRDFGYVQPPDCRSAM
jgi:hypothetical protein